MPHLGDRVKALRSRDRLSQSDLAEKLGMSSPSVSAIESRGSTSEDTIHKLTKLFNVEKDWLINGNGEAPVGVIIPKETQTSTPWKDEAYEVLKRENQRLWILVEKLSGAPVGSFLKRPDHAGLYVSYKKVQTGRQSGRDLREAA